uniref:Groucho/TLE N-terminal Q-rich domain-containing protein n=1 Tax=Knipowitschia caucasica TaxID=637954 RepID=A0AAV2MTX8_KNICA
MVCGKCDVPAVSAQALKCVSLSGLQHQQQVVQAVERAKQVTMAELNAIIGQQQLQAQHLSHGHAIPVPLTPHPAGLQPPLAPGASAASLLALSNALSHQLPIKDERKHHDNNISEHQRGTRRSNYMYQERKG